MSEPWVSEIDQAIRRAAGSGETLFIAHVAKGIAARCGGSPQSIAEELTRAGIKAGVTMRFGKPK